MNYLDIFTSQKITGAQGPYDSKVNNSSVRYGRNAMANYNNYIATYETEKLLPQDLDFSNVKGLTQDQFDKKMADAEKKLSDSKVNLRFTLKYLPEDKVDLANLNKMALLGAAYEELGKRVSVSLKEFNELLKTAFGENMTAEAFDINKDSQIDVAEYSTSILMADMLSKDTSKLDAKNITGEINTQGENMSLAYSNQKNVAAASEDAKNIYEAFKLADAKAEFVKDENNLS